MPIPLLDQNHPQDCRVSGGQHQHWWGGSLLFNNKKSAKNLFSSKLIELIEQKTISKVNISQLGLGKLRSRITIIPQDPVVLFDLDLYSRSYCPPTSLSFLIFDLYFRSYCPPALLSLLTWTYILDLVSSCIVALVDLDLYFTTCDSCCHWKLFAISVSGFVCWRHAHEPRPVGTVQRWSCLVCPWTGHTHRPPV